jgi:hypothetical protein
LASLTETSRKRYAETLRLPDDVMKMELQTQKKKEGDCPFNACINRA